MGLRRAGAGRRECGVCVGHAVGRRWRSGGRARAAVCVRVGGRMARWADGWRGVAGGRSTGMGSGRAGPLAQAAASGLPVVGR